MRFALALLGLLLVAPVAAAQGLPATSPTYTLTITGLAGEFSGLASNATANAPFSIEMVLAGVLCPQAVEVPVTITATAAGAPAFAVFSVDPPTINIAIAAGPHGVGPTPAGGGRGDATVIATIAGINANASVPVTVTASAPAPEGCQGAGPVAAAASEPAVIYANMTAPPPPVVEQVPEEKGFLPGPGALMGVLAGVVGAAILRRRA